MGAEVLVGEPGDDAFDTLEKLCDEYKMRVAITITPTPHITGIPTRCSRSAKVAANASVPADTGHWLRSGLNPVECLKKLEGRIVSFHFKDLDRAGPDAHDVPWGTGVRRERDAHRSPPPGTQGTVHGRVRVPLDNLIAGSRTVGCVL